MHMTACLAPLLVAILSAPLALAESSTQVYLDNGELNYVGSISVEANQRALALFASEETKPRVTDITVINPPWQPRFIASDKQVHQIKLP